jgi:murein DD-endopeptidase MepM/ murein hydrolase activator NlpD
MPDAYDALVVRLLKWIGLLVEKARGTHAEHRSNIPLLARLTAHLGIIALVIIGLLVSGVEIRAASPQPGQTADPGSDLPPIQLSDESNAGDLTIAAVPFTIVPKRARSQVVQYVVGPGDTVTGIAARFHISADSVLWSNAKLEDNPDMLSIGQNLNIPPTSGVLYTVQKGDSIEAIAAKFKANIADILSDPFDQSNHDLKASPPQLTVGAFLMVPGGEKPFVVRKVIYRSSLPSGAARGTSNFIWPVRACISQLFWARHPGYDLAAPKGTPVYAADSGYVEVVGWDNTGYGNMILLNHGNNFVTRYAHLSAFNVEAGQSVKKGDLIGRVGSTGHSTGPHLHFEVIFGGVQRNPAYFIAGKAPARCPGY